MRLWHQILFDNILDIPTSTPSPVGEGGNLYAFASRTQAWVDSLGLANLFGIGAYGSL